MRAKISKYPINNTYHICISYCSQNYHKKWKLAKKIKIIKKSISLQLRWSKKKNISTYTHTKKKAKNVAM